MAIVDSLGPNVQGKSDIVTVLALVFTGSEVIPS